jgi:hypothetical protein
MNLDSFPRAHEMLYVGIDPGQTGAAALLTDGGHIEALIIPTWTRKVFSAETVERVRQFIPRIRHATIEDVSPFGGGRRAAGLRHAAMNAGMWAGMLSALDMTDVRWVAPREWQGRILGKVPKGMTKEWARGMAGRLWKAQGTEAVRVWGDGVADALCIAEFARQIDYHARNCNVNGGHPR